MPRIYTRTGDEGETSLFDGTRTPKSDARVDLYGEADELNGWLGLCAELLLKTARAGVAGVVPDGEARRHLADLAAELLSLQNDLFAMGAILADPPRCRELVSGGTALPFDVVALERRIDAMQAELPPLRSFILPSGSEAAAALDVARTVCRRVERKAVALSRGDALPRGVIVHLNRLSDYLFVAARRANHVLGRPDVAWPPDQAPQEDAAP
jgi:cob(I)alamin adenosyltransferase